MAIDNPERFEALLAIADTLELIMERPIKTALGGFNKGYEPAEYEDL